MSALFLDTHSLIWFLAASPRLSTPAYAAINASLRAGHDLHFSAVSLAETVYLEEKGRVPPGTLNRILAASQRSGSRLIEVALTSGSVAKMLSIPRRAVPEMPDRMIAATALQTGLPLVTADMEIRASGIPTIW